MSCVQRNQRSTNSQGRWRNSQTALRYCHQQVCVGQKDGRSGARRLVSSALSSGIPDLPSFLPASQEKGTNQATSSAGTMGVSSSPRNGNGNTNTTFVCFPISAARQSIEYGSSQVWMTSRRKSIRLSRTIMPTVFSFFYSIADCANGNSRQRWAGTKCLRPQLS